MLHTYMCTQWTQAHALCIHVHMWTYRHVFHCINVHRVGMYTVFTYSHALHICVHTVNTQTHIIINMCTPSTHIHCSHTYMCKVHTYRCAHIAPSYIHVHKVHVCTALVNLAEELRMPGSWVLNPCLHTLQGRFVIYIFNHEYEGANRHHEAKITRFKLPDKC